jgi:hypothetical protein
MLVKLALVFAFFTELSQYSSSDSVAAHNLPHLASHEGLAVHCQCWVGTHMGDAKAGILQHRKLRQKPSSPFMISLAKKTNENKVQGFIWKNVMCLYG